ncbi:MAG: hypothetical protein QM733_17150 [Ilumatobacteraceae bacterium]
MTPPTSVTTPEVSASARFTAVGKGQDRRGDERDRGPGIEADGVDDPPRQRGLGGDRVEIVTGDVPAALTQSDGHRPADQAQPGDVGAAWRFSGDRRCHGLPR